MLCDGRACIDNSATEHTMRPTGIGRWNGNPLNPMQVARPAIYVSSRSPRSTPPISRSPNAPRSAYRSMTLTPPNRALT